MLLHEFRKGCDTQQALLRFWKNLSIVLMWVVKLVLLFSISRKYILQIQVRYPVSQRQQRLKVNGSFRLWKNLASRVSQGSTLWSLLFNIYVTNLLLPLNNSDVYSYANVTTVFVCDVDIESVITWIEVDSAYAVKWFSDNYMKINEDKCHLFIFGDITTKVCFS